MVLLGGGAVSYAQATPVQYPCMVILLDCILLHGSFGGRRVFALLVVEPCADAGLGFRV